MLSRQFSGWRGSSLRRFLQSVLAVSLSLITTSSASASDRLTTGLPISIELSSRTLERHPILLDGIPIRGVSEVTMTTSLGHTSTLTIGTIPTRLPEVYDHQGPTERWNVVAATLFADKIPVDDWSVAPGLPPKYWLSHDGDSCRLALSHRVHVHSTSDEIELWIDPATDEVMEKTSIRRHGDFNGEVVASIPTGNMPFSPSATLTQVGLSDLMISPAGVPSIVTDVTGEFQLSTSAPSLLVAASLTGPFMDVQNLGGMNTNVFTILNDGVFASIQMTDLTSEFSVAQASAFHGITKVRRWLHDLAPGFGAVTAPVSVNVNLAGTCYAAYLPIFQMIQLTRAGGGCANASYGTLLAHEYFHHIQEQIPGSPELEMEEANADIFAAFSMDDPRIGADYFGIGQSIRELTDPVVYPVASVFPQETGQPFACAFWDFRQILIDEIGTEPGATAAAELWLSWVFAGDGILDGGVLLDLLLLDDDDNDLSNGTPHVGALTTAFPAHGLDLPVIEATGLTCMQSEQTVLLEWELPVLGTHTSLDVVRDGRVIASLSPDTTSFIDDDPQGGQRTYIVISRQGSMSAPSSSCGLFMPDVQMFIRGDQNGDGALDLGDAIAILNHIFMGVPLGTCVDSLDVDDSGELDIVDPIRLVNYLFNSGPPPEAPFPTADFDPTPDEFLCL